MRRGERVCGCRPGFTVVELIATIGIVGVVVSLVVPALADSRREAVQLSCMAHTRSASQAISVYCNDWEGVFPFLGVEPRTIRFGTGLNAVVGGDYTYSAGWSLLLDPDHWSETGFDPSMRCPKQPDYDPDVTASGVLDGQLLLPTYGMSAALVHDSRSLAGEPWSRDAGDGAWSRAIESGSPRLRPNRVSSVRFASEKVLLWERLGFCVEGEPGARGWMELGQTSRYATSVSAVDGSVRRVARDRYAHTAIGGLAFDMTINGVGGRDLVSPGEIARFVGP